MVAVRSCLVVDVETVMDQRFPNSFRAHPDVRANSMWGRSLWTSGVLLLGEVFRILSELRGNDFRIDIIMSGVCISQ
jgi:hypothetical protein